MAEFCYDGDPVGYRCKWSLTRLTLRIFLRLTGLQAAQTATIVAARRSMKLPLAAVGATCSNVERHAVKTEQSEFTADDAL